VGQGGRWEGEGLPLARVNGGGKTPFVYQKLTVIIVHIPDAMAGIAVGPLAPLDSRPRRGVPAGVGERIAIALPLFVGTALLIRKYGPLKPSIQLAHIVPGREHRMRP
jgi:hypothetical protein